MARSLTFLLGAGDAQIARVRKNLEGESGFAALAHLAWKTFESIVAASGVDLSDRAEREQVAQLVGFTVASGVLAAIRRQHRNDAARSDKVLLRWYPDDAIALLNQSSVRVIDAFATDAGAFHSWTPRDRLGFLISTAINPSSRRGKRGSNVARELHYLDLYESAMKSLREWFSRGAIYDGDVRACLLRAKTSTRSRPLLDCLERSFRGKRIEKRLVAATFVSHEIAVAEEIVPKLSPKTILRKLPTWRQLAKELDRLPSRPT